MSVKGNDPSLVAKALAKAQSVESRLNTLIVSPGNPLTPTILYGNTGGNTVVTTSANGTYTWTCPAGVYTAMVECWGAGGGGGGGSGSEGAEGGGGGEYACEPAMAVVPGTVYSYTVGTAGTGGAGGGGYGSNGGDSFFNYGGTIGIAVYANGGDYTQGPFLGGNGGTGSVNTIHNNGGNGGGDGSQLTGGCGGGGSGGGGGAGGSGTDSTGSSGTAGGAAGAASAPQSGGAHGGAGGASGVSGVAGASPGGGGGGCGDNTGLTTLTKQYNATGTRSYYGSDATGSPNGVRSTNGTIWSGGETATGGSYNGTQKSIITFPTSPNIISDFSGYTMTSCTFGLYCQHTWYGQGGLISIRAWEAGGGAPSSWNGSTSASAQIANSSCYAGQSTNYSLGQAVAAAFAAGTYFGITIGPGTPAYNLWNYGYFSGASGPTLKLSGTVGGASISGASGSDGQVQITYTPPSTALVAAVQAGSPTGATTTDTAGNQLAVGVTVAPVAGTTNTGVVAVQPASVPAVLETWHAIVGGVGYQNSWADYSGGPKGQYKMTADNAVWLIGNITPGTRNDGTVMFTLPVGYRPTNQVCFPIGQQGSGTATISGNTPSAFIAIATSGQVSLYGCNLGNTLTFVHIDALIPLDTLQ
jgi:hypothetical protein